MRKNKAVPDRLGRITPFGAKAEFCARPNLAKFQLESNRIEGIDGARDEEIEALRKLLKTDTMWFGELADYVRVIQPDAQLRATENVPGVCVGNHVAPPSGPLLMMSLDMLLDRVNLRTISPFDAHCEYEMLHPFTDGNGRSGRALWLWMHRGDAPLGFLHQFYYEALASLEGK